MVGLNRKRHLTKMSGSYAVARMTSTPCGKIGCNVLFRRFWMVLVNCDVVESADNLTLNYNTARY